jgi:hypothetical protein
MVKDGIREENWQKSGKQETKENVRKTINAKVLKKDEWTGKEKMHRDKKICRIFFIYWKKSVDNKCKVIRYI